MEKMDFIQTCLNNKLLEANLPCIASPAGCAPHVVVLGLGLILGCFPATAKPSLGNPGQSATGGKAQGNPKKRLRQKELREVFIVTKDQHEEEVQVWSVKLLLKLLQ